MSGRKSRQARRVPVPPPPPTRSAPDRKRLLLAAIVAAVVVVAAILGLSLALSGKSKQSTPASGAKLSDSASVAALFRGIPQRGLVLGAADAPVTLVEYLDLQCPWCGKFARDSFPDVVSQFVRPGKVRVEIRPLAFVGSDSVRGKNALLAASEQNRAFQFAALLYGNQGTENTGWLSGDMVRAAAASVPGLEVERVATAGSAAAIDARIERQRAGDGVTGVPTFFVKRTGEPGSGTMLVNPTGEALTAALERA